MADKKSVEVCGGEESDKGVTDRVAGFGWNCVETDEGGEGEGEVEFTEVVSKGGTLGVEVLAFEDAVMNRALHRAVITMIHTGSGADEGGTVCGTVPEAKAFKHDLGGSSRARLVRGCGCLGG